METRRDEANTSVDAGRHHVAEVADDVGPKYRGRYHDDDNDDRFNVRVGDDVAVAESRHGVYRKVLVRCEADLEVKLTRKTLGEKW